MKMNFRKTLVKEHIKEPYTVKIEVINKSRIHKFVRPEWHRDFRDVHVRSIRNGVLTGKHFIGCITVNEVNDTFRILDGNHRMEAMRQILKEYPKFKIEIRIQKYINLSKEQELEVYTILNRHKPETVLDFIKAYCIRSYFVKEAAKNFPIRVLFRQRGKGDVNSLSIIAVCFPYIHRQDNSFVGSVAKDTANSINEFENMDVERMRNFFNFYKRVFGDIVKDNLYSDTNLISVIAKIYYTNVGSVLNEKEFQKKLEKIKARYTANLTQYSGAGWDKAKDLYLFIISKLKVKKLYNVFEQVKE